MLIAPKLSLELFSASGCFSRPCLMGVSLVVGGVHVVPRVRREAQRFRLTFWTLRAHGSCAGDLYRPEASSVTTTRASESSQEACRWLILVQVRPLCIDTWGTRNCCVKSTRLCGRMHTALLWSTEYSTICTVHNPRTQDKGTRRTRSTVIYCTLTVSCKGRLHITSSIR